MCEHETCNPAVEKEIVVLNFYADWCRYSSALKPIFDEAANQIHTESVSRLLMLQQLLLLSFYRVKLSLEKLIVKHKVNI